MIFVMVGLCILRRVSKPILDPQKSGFSIQMADCAIRVSGCTRGSTWHPQKSVFSIWVCHLTFVRADPGSGVFSILCLVYCSVPQCVLSTVRHRRVCSLYRWLIRLGWVGFHPSQSIPLGLLFCVWVEFRQLPKMLGSVSNVAHPASSENGPVLGFVFIRPGILINDVPHEFVFSVLYRFRSCMMATSFLGTVFLSGYH